MHVQEGNDMLLDLAKKYLSNSELIDSIKAIISSSPSRVAVRGVFEIINTHKERNFSAEDREKIDDLFYYFG